MLSPPGRLVVASGFSHLQDSLRSGAPWADDRVLCQHATLLDPELLPHRV